MAVTWNPADKDPGVVLSNNNLTAVSNETYGKTVRATASKSSGKHYFEVTVDSVHYSRPVIGICAVDTSLNYVLGNGEVAKCCRWNETSISNLAASPIQSQTVASKKVGDVVGVAVDMDAGTVQYYRNGVVLGNALTGILTSISAAYPAVSVDSTGGATANFSPNSPPSGYSAWDPVEITTVTTDTLRQTTTATSVPVDTFRQVGTAESVSIDTLRQTITDATATIDTSRRTKSTISAPIDTSRRRTIPFGFNPITAPRGVVVTADALRRLE